MMQGIRNVVAADIPGIKQVLETIELFPSEYLDDMIADYLQNSESEDIWFVALDDGQPLGFGYCAPEKFTDGTFNLYAIGVQKAAQGKGIGGKLMAYIEDLLRKAGHRVLIVETSSDAGLAKTRAFYDKLGYAQEATIRDFWQEGEHKVVFWKKLNTK